MSCSIMKAAAAEPDAAELLPVDFALPKTMCAPPWTAAAGRLQLRVLRLHWGPLTGDSQESRRSKMQAAPGANGSY